MKVLLIVYLVIAFACLAYSAHLAVVFQRFNDGIRDWSRRLDESTREAIDRSARDILRELDRKISENNSLNDNTNE